MEDLLEQANEIQETLGRSYAVPDEIDEADLQAGEFISFFTRAIQIFISDVEELDALELEEEDGGASYLTDLNKAPDYIDEEPLDIGEVCT